MTCVSSIAPARRLWSFGVVRRYLVSEKRPSDHGLVALSGAIVRPVGVVARDRAASVLRGSADQLGRLQRG